MNAPVLPQRTPADKGEVRAMANREFETARQRFLTVWLHEVGRMRREDRQREIAATASAMRQLAELGGPV